MFYDSCLAAEVTQLIKKQLRHLQLESNVILETYKQRIKILTLMKQLKVFFFYSR